MMGLATNMEGETVTSVLLKIVMPDVSVTVSVDVDVVSRVAKVNGALMPCSKLVRLLVTLAVTTMTEVLVGIEQEYVLIRSFEVGLLDVLAAAAICVKEVVDNSVSVTVIDSVAVDGELIVIVLDCVRVVVD